MSRGAAAATFALLVYNMSGGSTLLCSLSGSFLTGDLLKTDVIPGKETAAVPDPPTRDVRNGHERSFIKILALQLLSTLM